MCTQTKQLFPSPPPTCADASLGLEKSDQYFKADLLTRDRKLQCLKISVRVLWLPLEAYENRSDCRCLGLGCRGAACLPFLHLFLHFLPPYRLVHWGGMTKWFLLRCSSYRWDCSPLASGISYPRVCCVWHLCAMWKLKAE